MSQLFKFKAYSHSGELVNGEITAESEKEAFSNLRKDYKLVIKVSTVSQSIQRKRITLSDLEQSTNQLSRF